MEEIKDKEHHYNLFLKEIEKELSICFPSLKNYAIIRKKITTQDMLYLGKYFLRVENRKNIKRLKELKTGDCFTLRRDCYDKWFVLEQKKGETICCSERFNLIFDKTSNDWYKSGLRKWLNKYGLKQLLESYEINENDVISHFPDLENKKEKDKISILSYNLRKKYKQFLNCNFGLPGPELTLTPKDNMLCCFNFNKTLSDEYFTKMAKTNFIKSSIDNELIFVEPKAEMCVRMLVVFNSNLLCAKIENE